MAHEPAVAVGAQPSPGLLASLGQTVGWRRLSLHTRLAAAGFLFVLPAVLLSGIMTPISAMPPWLQAATFLNPLRFFAELVRGVLLRGSGIADLWPQVLALAVYGAVILAIATLRFHRQLG